MWKMQLLRLGGGEKWAEYKRQTEEDKRCQIQLYFAYQGVMFCIISPLYERAEIVCLSDRV